jgi:hypothetical protein
MLCFRAQSGVFGVVFSLMLLASGLLLTSPLFLVSDAVGIHAVPYVPRLLLLTFPQYPSCTLLLAFLLLPALLRTVEGILTVASFYCCYHCYCWRPFVSGVLTVDALLAFLLLLLFLLLLGVLLLTVSLLLLACLLLLPSTVLVSLLLLASMMFPVSLGCCYYRLHSILPAGCCY